MYIYIYNKIKFTVHIHVLVVYICGAYPQIYTTRTSCPMCMHAGSPLQKNAPIFGNVFTVTSLIQYYLRIVTCM